MKIFLWCGVICFLIGIFVFGIGYHNIDLSINMPEGFVDINPFGVVKTKVEMYLIGLQAILISEFLNIIGMILILFGVDKK